MSVLDLPVPPPDIVLSMEDLVRHTERVCHQCVFVRELLVVSDEKLFDRYHAERVSHQCVFIYDLLVVSKMVLSTKSFVTDITRKGSLISVRSFVDQQIVRLGELALAEFTDEFFLRSGKEA